MSVHGMELSLESLQIRRNSRLLKSLTTFSVRLLGRVATILLEEPSPHCEAGAGTGDSKSETKSRANTARAVAFTQPSVCSETIGLGSDRRWHMFDVYLNHKRDLLVVRQGSSIPLGGTSGRWQKRK